MRQTTHFMRRFVTITLAFGLITMLGANALAQSDPTRIGAGQIPYVMIVLDTSASMEFTDEGDEEYPHRAENATDTPSQPKEWSSNGSLRIKAGEETGRPDGPAKFGPCFVWEPKKCENYHRPPWNTESEGEWESDYFDTGDLMHTRYQEMRGATTVLTDLSRLRNDSQPRHVTLKEILTGEMILLTTDDTAEPTTFNPVDRPPGCWFVPRQVGASALHPDDQKICDGKNKFNDLPDSDDARPHFQEVWDAQHKTGVMDLLGNTAIFSVAMFDGFRDDVETDPWKKDEFDELNDDMAGSRPTAGVRGSSNPDEGDECYSTGDDSTGPPCYDLGVFSVVGPHDLDIPSRFLGELSTFTQLALVDAGYLSQKEDDKYELKPKEDKSGKDLWKGANFSKDLDKFVDDYTFAKQPIARATPLAAAVHDIRQFMTDGQENFDKEDRNPIQDDPFGRCRPKHVVLLTDGYPEPEAGSGIGSETLNPAFGYDKKQYTYDVTETEIAAFVADTGIPAKSDRFRPRVHVVGLRVEGSAATKAAVLDKLGNMAIAGKTCAGQRLGDQWKESPEGTCDASTEPCLISGQPTYSWVDPDDPTASAVTCKYPALVLDSNDPADLQKALREIMQKIVGTSGVASRTKTVVSNNLDDGVKQGQNRFFTGVQIGGSTFWKGLIERQTIPCSGSVSMTELQEEINDQAKITSAGVRQDNRRVFTSLAAKSIYNYDDDGGPDSDGDGSPDPIGPIRPTVGGVLNETFFFTYGFELASADEFGGQTMQNDATTTADVVGARVPIEYTALKDTVDATNADDLEDFLKLMSAPNDPSVGPDWLKETINTFRGRIADKLDVPQGGALSDGEGRVLNGILNANPVVVGPPAVDLPIESFRRFKARYANRPTMLYQATLDGQLHAIHSGVLTGKFFKRAMKDEDGTPTDAKAGATEDASLQREAWAYMPQFLAEEMAINKNSQPFSLDGSPTVKDVRLCQPNPDHNQHPQACRSLCKSSSSCQVDAALQWRTVLVQGMGTAGNGYYAIDITRPGGEDPIGAGLSGSIVNPDPLPLWEFNRRWEKRQLGWLMNSSGSQEVRVEPNGANIDSGEDGGCSDADELWSQPLLGKSVSDPAIATLLVKPGSQPLQQRPVAVFGGGAGDTGFTGCAAEEAGQAIYVVDLQTGALLRRFVDYSDPNDGGKFKLFSKFDGDSNERAFLVGSPALHDASTGSVATRGFIGDNEGRLYRMDFTNPDPAQWKVTLFFDPGDSSENSDVASALDGVPDADSIGPAAFRPAIALGPNREVTVTYGLGDTGDVVAKGEAQAMITLTEDVSNPGDGNLVWAQVFDEGEKLMGEPLVFNSTTFFPTYKLPDADVCKIGTARIWALDYFEADTSGSLPLPLGRVSEVFGISSGTASLAYDSGGDKWFGPTGDGAVLIRGLTLTLNRACSLVNPGSDNPLLSDSPDASPQLIAQTGSRTSNTYSDKVAADAGETLGDDRVHRMVVDVAAPRSQMIPLSWGVVNN